MSTHYVSRTISYVHTHTRTKADATLGEVKRGSLNSKNEDLISAYEKGTTKLKQ